MGCENILHLWACLTCSLLINLIYVCIATCYCSVIVIIINLQHSNQHFSSPPYFFILWTTHVVFIEICPHFHNAQTLAEPLPHKKHGESHKSVSRHATFLLHSCTQHRRPNTFISVHRYKRRARAVGEKLVMDEIYVSFAGIISIPVLKNWTIIQKETGLIYLRMCQEGPQTCVSLKG